MRAVVGMEMYVDKKTNGERLSFKGYSTRLGLCFYLYLFLPFIYVFFFLTLFISRDGSRMKRAITLCTNAGGAPLWTGNE